MWAALCDSCWVTFSLACWLHTAFVSRISFNRTSTGGTSALWTPVGATVFPPNIVVHSLVHVNLSRKVEFFISVFASVQLSCMTFLNELWSKCQFHYFFLENSISKHRCTLSYHITKRTLAYGRTATDLYGTIQGQINSVYHNKSSNMLLWHHMRNGLGGFARWL